uniref:GAR domain-containing protein n=1 Tax=Rhabditophanes sp. KR3021 TaxID=114890 RepID=A0AC35U0F9_9BILA
MKRMLSILVKSMPGENANVFQKSFRELQEQYTSTFVQIRRGVEYLNHVTFTDIGQFQSMIDTCIHWYTENEQILNDKLPCINLEKLNVLINSYKQNLDNTQENTAFYCDIVFPNTIKHLKVVNHDEKDILDYQEKLSRLIELATMQKVNSLKSIKLFRKGLAALEDLQSKSNYIVNFLKKHDNSDLKRKISSTAVVLTLEEVDKFNTLLAETVEEADKCKILMKELDVHGQAIITTCLMEDGELLKKYINGIQEKYLALIKSIEFMNNVVKKNVFLLSMGQNRSGNNGKVKNLELMNVSPNNEDQGNGEESEYHGNDDQENGGQEREHHGNDDQENKVQGGGGQEFSLEKTNDDGRFEANNQFKGLGTKKVSAIKHVLEINKTTHFMNDIKIHGTQLPVIEEEPEEDVLNSSENIEDSSFYGGSASSNSIISEVINCEINCTRKKLSRLSNLPLPVPRRVTPKVAIVKDKRPPFRTYHSAPESSHDIIKIENEIRRQIEKCTCLNRFNVKKISESQNAVLYEFGKQTSIKRHVRFLQSSAIVRVGGRWETVISFFSKCDPCRGRQRQSCEARPTPLSTDKNDLLDYTPITALKESLKAKNLSDSSTPQRKPAHTSRRNILFQDTVHE